MQINHIAIIVLLGIACNINAVQNREKKKTRQSLQRPALQQEPYCGKIEQAAKNKLKQRGSKRAKKAVKSENQSFNN